MGFMVGNTVIPIVMCFFAFLSVQEHYLAPTASAANNIQQTSANQKPRFIMTSGV